MKKERLNYPSTNKIRVVDTLHGTEIIDNYRWLENGKGSKVKEWTEVQEKFTRSILDKLPQRLWLIERLNQLQRYDDKSAPLRALNGERIFLRTKKKEDEHWVYNTKENESAPSIELLNPNKWGPTETLDLTSPSRDGKYLAFGKAEGGNENPVIKIIEVSTKKILPDLLKGWRQCEVSWLPDNSGFFYGANPLKGEVPEGEEDYWHSVYYHKLGTPPLEDKKVFYHEKVKEYFHCAHVTEDGKYILFYRSQFSKNEAYFKRAGSDEAPTPIVTGFDASYFIDVIVNKFFIKTDLNAPMGKVYITDVDKPGKENWKEFIPETRDNLLYITGIAGRIYAVYSHNAQTRIKIYSLDGEYIRDLPLPTIGSAQIWGYWSKPEIWVNFSSFTHPSTIFKYNFDKNELELYHKPPIDIDVSNYVTEQVWYKSKDGTDVSMFLIHHKDIKRDGNNPTLLTGYGGFNIPLTPSFLTSYVVWLEAGGMVVIPNLRGGGEYGREWHEAGMKEKKKNVFDDFIAAAEWLIENKYTEPEKLGISGGSNGGLLVGAVTVQRPELFKVVNCAVPLLDMVRYHKFGLANIWATEYGNSDDPGQFKYLCKYSPYHNVINGTKYPAMLITGSENDARVDPLHARKMVARMQEANPDGEPILLLIRRASGHGGGTTISSQIEQSADVLAFLMDKLGMKPLKK
jgi:prolyl oligopeptidase